MTNLKFIESNFDGKISMVRLSLENHLFTGWAVCHPDDIMYKSELTGCTLAELRATIRALKWKRRSMREKVNNYKYFVSKCLEYKDFDCDSPTGKAIMKQLHIQMRDLRDINEEIDQCYKDIDTIIKSRQHYINNVNKKKNESKEVNS